MDAPRRWQRWLAAGGVGVAMCLSVGTNVSWPLGGRATAQPFDEQSGRQPPDHERQRMAEQEEERQLLEELAQQQHRTAMEQEVKRRRDAQFMRYLLVLAVIVMVTTVLVTYVKSQQRSPWTPEPGRGGGMKDDG